MLRENRKRLIRNRLLETGLEGFVQRGFHATGVQDLVDEAGVPKGSFYNYFASKEAFGASVIDLYAGRIHQRLDELGLEEGDALQKLRGFLEAKLQHHEEQRHGCLLGNLGCEVGAESERLQASLSDGISGVRERFAHLIAKGQEQGSVRANIPADDLAGVLFSAWEGALMRMQVEGSTSPVEQCLRLMLDEFLRP